MLDYLEFYYIFWAQSEVEETLKRVQSHKGVTGVIIVNQEGNYNVL